MDNLNKKIKKIAADIKLLPQEKGELKLRLVDFMRREREMVETRPQASLIMFPPVFAYLNLKRFSLSFAALFLVFFGVSFAAERSLPGDLFYPIKTGVNEKLAEFASFSEFDRASLELKLADRRLEEIEELAVLGRLKPEIKADVESNFEKHSSSAQKRLQNFGDSNKLENASDISSRLETSLTAHEGILDELNSKKDGGKEMSLDSILEKIKEDRKQVSDRRRLTESRISVESDEQFSKEAPLRHTAAQNKISEVSKLVSQSNDLSLEIKTEALSNLAEAEKLLSLGKTKLDNSESGKAFNHFQKALQLAEKTRLIVGAKSNLQIEVRFPNLEKNSDDQENESGSLEKSDSISEIEPHEMERGDTQD